MEIAIFVALAVVFVGLIVWAVGVSEKQMLANLRALAERQGLSLRGVDGSRLSWKPSIEGEKNGRDVRFWSFATGSGKSRQHWIAVGVRPRELGDFSFDLRPQGMLSKLSELFGAKEAKTGDAAFDERWFLGASAPDVLAAALVPEIRAKLDAAWVAGARSHFRTQEGWVCYAELGGFADARKLQRLEGLLPLLRDLTDVVEVCARR